MFLVKSFLSLIIILSALFAMFTMFEVFGRGEKRYNVDRLKRLHRINGRFYILLFLFVSYFCLKFILDTRTELSPRSTFHALFALTIVVLFVLKVSFIRIYRGFYSYAKTFGLLIAIITFGMVGTSAGYYLLVTKFSTEIKFRQGKKTEKEVLKEEFKIAVKTDEESIRRGKELYDSKCYSCHDPFSNDTIIGPGHKGILKNPLLPVSKRPATPENIVLQLKQPFDQMPPFDYLTDEEIEDIIAYLNTL